jgi:uncharacterized protein (TIGR01777 family)
MKDETRRLGFFHPSSLIPHPSFLCVFIHRSRIGAPAEEVFRWHARPGAFERLTPPWEPVEVLERYGGIEDGARTVLRVRVGPLWRRWVAEHRDYQEGRQFRDVQVEGPFAHWDHLHRIEPDGPDACFLEDHIEYVLPLGVLGRLLGGQMVRRKLEKTFAYRHRTTMLDLAAHQRWQATGPLRVLVSGASGLIGSALVPFLTTDGHRVTCLKRSALGPGEQAIRWNPATGPDPAELEDFDAVVHLAGESLTAAKWTAARKAAIRTSRVQGTRRLCEVLARLERPPRILVCASCLGYYGSRGDELLDEQSAHGSGFFAGVCREWEEAAGPARDRGIRVVHLRFGTVLSPRGGVLGRLLPWFRKGLGGRLGCGRQFLSWISLDDAVGAIHHALMDPALHGPVNAVAPHPVRNRDFITTLGRVLRRPTVAPLPAFLLRKRFGEMADELLLAGTRVEPERLWAAGYRFRDPELPGALRHLLGKPAPQSK